MIPADGFYEWIANGKEKLPMYISLQDRRPFVMAGLWERWTDKETGDSIESCSIITTNAAAKIAHIHDRMPVILPSQHHAMWLDPEFSEKESLNALLKPFSDEELDFYPVSKQVNKVASESPDANHLVEPIASQKSLLD